MLHLCSRMRELMRKKELKIVVTFHTTADAMAMEKACKQHQSEGKLIPVPRQLSAGCGISWSAALTERDNLMKILQDSKIEYEEIAECEV